MPTASAQAPVKANPARQRAIAPYLEKLDQLYRGWDEAGGGGSFGIRLYESLLTLDPWETDRIRDFVESGKLAADGCSILLAQTVALLLKSAADIESMMSAVDLPEEELYELQAELMLDTAIGMALLREAQKMQNDLVRGGETAQAKKLSRFQHKLRNSLADVKKMIGESERARAEQISDDLTDEPRQESASPEKLVLDHAATRAAQEWERLKVQEKAKRMARTALSKLPSRTDLLIYAFLLAMAAWLGAVKLPEIIRRQPPPPGLADFQADGLFLRVDAKPPSLFIEVEPDSWAEIDAGKRLALTEMVGDILAAKGYSGALLKTGRNRPLAQWLRGRGAMLIENGESASPSGQQKGSDATFVP